MTDTIWLGFDGLLVLSLWILAWMACSTQNTNRAITLCIAFGLLLALVWARLNAPDLALAEAAIGAGIAGVLLLAASRDQQKAGGVPVEVVSAPLRWLINLLCLGLFALISTALWQGMQTPADNDLAQLVAAKLSASGVTNPVTAVLLNVRAWDTMLELAVVLAAVLAITALAPMRPPPAPAGQLLRGLVRWLVPLLIVTAGYLLWVGAHAPGGAFQAGALLAASLILLHMARLPGQPMIGLTALRWLLVIGIGVFATVGIITMLYNNAFLAYFPGSAGVLILLIEFAATLSIAAALVLAYAGGHPDGWNDATTSTDNNAAGQES